MIDCANSLAPDGEALLRHILDEDPLSEEARIHIEQCQICQQRLADYRQAHSLLLSHLYRRQCPDGTQLSLYCAGLLPMNEQIHIATHLLACPLCAAEAAETRRFFAEVEPLPVPSTSLHAFPHTIRRIFATLVTPPEANTVRGGPVAALPPTSWPRQYQDESINVSLHLSRDSKKEIVLLAIMSNSDPTVRIETFEGVEADLYAILSVGEEQSEHESQRTPAKSPVIRTYVDDTGNMVFRAVPPGNYDLVVRLPEYELIIKDVIITSG